VAVTLYPFVHVIFASVSDSIRLAGHRGLLLFPLSISLEAYKAVFGNPNILSGYSNTILYLVTGTTINMVLTSVGAYALSRRRMLLRDFIMFAITFTMLFRGGLIPTYILVKQLGMMDTIWALTVPSAVSTMNLIIMRTSFQSIPDSLEESAKMDGANDFVIFLRIALPLSMSVVAVMILFYSVYHWDSWFPAAIYIRTRERYPLQLVLREILIQNQTDSMMTSNSAQDDRASIETTIKYATIVVSTIPILVVYPMLQRYFVKGVMIGAIKG
jgi:putative aldouronate transport system permease protein